MVRHLTHARWILVSILLFTLAGPALAQDHETHATAHKATSHHHGFHCTPDYVVKGHKTPVFLDGVRHEPEELQARDHGPCVAGDADGYPCNNVDLAAFTPLGLLGGGEANDIWGWTDPDTGKEYAILGRTSGTSFIDISDPSNLIFLGVIPTHTTSSPWRDIKTYQNYAYIVAEAEDHGMQVFDLTRLRNVATPPESFSVDAHYDNFGRAHNIVINEDSGFAYAVGSRQGDTTCSGGLHMLDLSNPGSPSFAGCYSSDGYTHDAQCVNYNGPDTDHQGKEICLASNEDTMTLVDVSDKSNPVLISRTDYAGRSYCHQGWLTEDQAYFFLDDEGDEQDFGHGTRTFVWDMRDLDNPSVINSFFSSQNSTDHNQYVLGDYVYQANYNAGLRILRIDDISTGSVSEAAFFDVRPTSDSDGFNGAWSVYPYFDSGRVIVSGIEQGLFVLEPVLCVDPAVAAGLSASPAGDNQIDLSWTASPDAGVTYNVYRGFGDCPGGANELVASGLTSPSYSDAGVSGSVTYNYRVTVVDESGECESEQSVCTSASTTGACTAPPIFAGLETATNAGGTSCRLDLSWSAAAENCAGPVTYSVYRDTTPGFAPGPGNLLASDLSGTTYADFDVTSDVAYYYVVRSTDTSNGVEDGNTVELSSTPTGPLGNGTFAAGAEIGDPQFFLGSNFAQRHVGWELSDARQNSGSRSYFSTYQNNECLALTSPELQLTAGQASQLSFWHWYEIEDGYDGGVVEISTDGGSNWSILTPSGGYPGAFNPSGDACGYPGGTAAYTDNQNPWGQETFDLSAYAGQSVLIRWQFSTDQGLTLEGWYVDDVNVTHAQVPQSCESADVLFADGFEAGDTSNWDNVTP